MHAPDDEETQDIIYRYDYLSAFNLKEYDSDVIMKTLEEVYEILKCDKDFIEMLEAHPQFYEDKKNYEFVMQLMFSFDTFDLFHSCLVYLLYKYRLDEKKSIKNLLKKNTDSTNILSPSEIVSTTSIHVIPENLYSYFTFENNKNKLIERLKNN
jgi:bisphosphoglycerate-independent phosphoglycerate mutase (AlkP superfamily)